MLFGKTQLVVGSETLLVERAVAGALDAAKKERPDTTVSRISAVGLEVGSLLEVTGGSLLSAASTVVVSELSELSADAADVTLKIALASDPDLALILVHPGGVKGKGLLDKLKKAKVPLTACTAIKAWEVPDFAQREAFAAGGKLDARTATMLVEAVGSDLSAVAAAVQQLLADSTDQVITPALVKQYFSGRAEATSFAVADDTMQGGISSALGKLRWALATGASPAMVTSSMASALRSLGKYLAQAGSGGSDVDLGRAIGVPPWKIKTLAKQARGWNARGIGNALACVAKADAAVKGGEADADYALEQMVIAVSRFRKK